MQSFLKVMHREIARKMNDPARARLYPDQTDSNPESFYNKPEWHAFTLYGSSRRNTINMKQATTSQETTTVINYEYRTDGRKYYTGPQALDISSGNSLASSATRYSSVITTYKPERQVRMQSTLPYGGQRSDIPYYTRPPSLDGTVSSSTITDSSSDATIEGLRHKIAQMKAAMTEMTKYTGTESTALQPGQMSALAKFERHLLEQTEHSIKQAVSSSNRDLETKFEQRSQQTESSFFQALGQATATMKQEMDSSKNMYNDTLLALKDMMLAQQQQMQQQMHHQQQHIQEQQEQNREYHRIMMDRLATTDHSLALMQQTAPLYDTQQALLSQIASSDPNAISDVTIRPISISTHEGTLQPSTDARPKPHVAVQPASSTNKPKQTVLKTGTNGVIQLSSSSVNTGQSSRPNVGSTKGS